MSSFSRAASERKAESRIERRATHVDREPSFHRFAGEIFGTKSKEGTRQKINESRRKLQSSRPVGVGFGTEDKYGPDENWDTKDPIEHTPAPGYYKSYKSF